MSASKNIKLTSEMLQEMARWEPHALDANEAGLWCPNCALPSAFGITVVWVDPDTLQQMCRDRAAWCPECCKHRYIDGELTINRQPKDQA